jgi:mannose/fructose/N-acetylgalactosamine-specific phosphotransferase system component IIB
MGKTYVRVDDRLIHGQTIVSWCPLWNIKEIIGVDDENATNPTLKSIMVMSVPPMYKTHVVTTEDAKALLSEKSERNRLVIVKFPAVLQDLLESIRDCECIQLGNVSKRADSVHQLSGATGIFFLSKQEVENIDSLVQQGFDVHFQQLPNMAKTSWESFKKTI